MVQKQRIYSVKSNSLNEADRLEIARLLVKAGYAVRIGRERAKPNAPYIYFVEFWEVEE